MSNAHTFRTIARLEEQMMRAAMPRTDAVDPRKSFRVRQAEQRMARLERRPAVLTFTLAEVARA